MEKIIKTGKRLRFRQATEADMDYIMQVEYIPENAKYVIPYTREVHMQTLDTKSATHLIIETIDGKEKVGFLMIAGLDNPSKEIEWTRIILDVKGKGYGQETLEMLKSWAFDDLKFHRAWLDCKDHNTRALHVYEKAGLVREGLISPLDDGGNLLGQAFLLGGRHSRCAPVTETVGVPILVIDFKRGNDLYVHTLIPDPEADVRGLGGTLFQIDGDFHLQCFFGYAAKV